MCWNATWISFYSSNYNLGLLNFFLYLGDFINEGLIIIIIIIMIVAIDMANTDIGDWQAHVHHNRRHQGNNIFVLAPIHGSSERE